MYKNILFIILIVVVIFLLVLKNKQVYLILQLQNYQCNNNFIIITIYLTILEI